MGLLGARVLLLSGRVGFSCWGAWASPVGPRGLLLSGRVGFSCRGACASPVGPRGLLLSGRVGFSGWGVPAPEREGLVVMHSIWDLISLTRD